MNRHTIALLLRLLGRRAWLIPALVVLSVLASLAEGLGVGLLIPFLHALIGGGDAAAGGGPPGPVVAWLTGYGEAFESGNRLTIVAGAIVALAAVRSAVIYADAAASAWISGGLAHSLRIGLMRQVLDVDYEFLCRTDNGALLNTIDNETGRTTAAISCLFGMMTQVSMITVFVALLLLISWPLTLIVGAGMLLISAFGFGLARRASAISDEAVVASQRLSERSLEIFDGMRIIRAFGQQRRETRRFSGASEQVRGTEFRLDLITGLVHPALEILYAPLFVGVLLLAARYHTGVPATLVFLLLLYRLQPYVKGLNHSRMRLAALSGAVRNVVSLLDRSDKPYTQSGSLRFTGLASDVEFDKVGFSYGDSARPVLKDASFTFRKGEVTALVGASGAGKSTLINLLYRFYEPARGTILVDGRPLSELDVSTWRDALAISGQDAELMSGTIGENIGYADPDADPAQIIVAARRASAHEFIDALPLRYDTLIGQRGLRLSGGQRQRIALARALLRQPQILILDEATNALDSVTEAEIHDTFETLRGHCTILVIAHRLGTIRNADHVVVLQDGRVAEAASPRELLRQNGVLARMYDLQLLPRGGELIATSPEPATGPAEEAARGFPHGPEHLLQRI
jgi:subfamily B ATP-binding cassette protein MsbA